MSTTLPASPNRPAASLIARIFPRRALLLKRSWIIGGHGRAMPGGRPGAEEAGRPLQLRRDQIVAVAEPILELREDQIIARGSEVPAPRFARVPTSIAA